MGLGVGIHIRTPTEEGEAKQCTATFTANNNDTGPSHTGNYLKHYLLESHRGAATPAEVKTMYPLMCGNDGCRQRYTDTKTGKAALVKHKAQRHMLTNIARQKI